MEGTASHYKLSGASFRHIPASTFHHHISTQQQTDIPSCQTCRLIRVEQNTVDAQHGVPVRYTGRYIRILPQKSLRIAHYTMHGDTTDAGSVV
jgi:hypothetical protein